MSTEKFIPFAIEHAGRMHNIQCKVGEHGGRFCYETSDVPGGIVRYYPLDVSMEVEGDSLGDFDRGLSEKVSEAVVAHFMGKQPDPLA